MIKLFFFIFVFFVTRYGNAQMIDVLSNMAIQGQMTGQAVGQINTAFSMVQQMGGDQQLSAHVVITSSALCLVTLFGWIYLLGYLDLL